MYEIMKILGTEQGEWAPILYFFTALLSAISFLIVSVPWVQFFLVRILNSLPHHFTLLTSFATWFYSCFIGDNQTWLQIIKFPEKWLKDQEFYTVIKLELIVNSSSCLHNESLKKISKITITVGSLHLQQELESSPWIRWAVFCFFPF